MLLFWLLCVVCGLGFEVSGLWFVVWCERLGAIWAHLGAMLAYVVPSWSYVGPSWGYVGPSWGLCWPILGLCWPSLGAMLAHLDAMLAHLEAYAGPCWPILSHMCDVYAKTCWMSQGQKHCKLQGFLSTRAPYQRSAAGAAAPLSYGEERNAYGKDTARGPLAGFKRLRATAGQGPNYVGPFCGYVGLCWPMLAYLAGNVGPSCGYVGLCWPHVEPKDPKNGNSKKTL